MEQLPQLSLRGGIEAGVISRTSVPSRKFAGKRRKFLEDGVKIARFFSRRLALVIFAVAALVGWLGRESLLQGAADLWIVSDPLTHADAIVVLGGNSQTRPLAAADLYR